MLPISLSYKPLPGVVDAAPQRFRSSLLFAPEMHPDRQGQIVAASVTQVSTSMPKVLEKDVVVTRHRAQTAAWPHGAHRQQQQCLYWFAPLNPCATTNHSTLPFRLAGGLACFTVANRRFSSATSVASAPPANTFAMNAPPGCSAS